MTGQTDDIEDFDFGAILGAPARRAGQTLNGRRSLDRKKLSEADRRKIQTTGRTEQMNLRIRPMTKVQFMQIAQRKDILPAVLLELMIEHWVATGDQ